MKTYLTTAALSLLILAQPAHAAIIVTGTNSGAPGFSNDPGDWNGDTTVYIANGAPGTLDVTDGSGLDVKSIIVGMFGIGSMTVSGGTVTTWGGDGLVVGNGGTASLLVNNGGSVSSPAATIGWSTENNSVTVTGADSQWDNGGDLRLGYFANGNTITIADGGLVKVGGTLSVNDAGHETDNFLRFDGGYLALLGEQTNDVTSYITGGKVQIWNGTDWVVDAALGSFSFAYYATDMEAEALTGYSGLGDYTILMAIPESSTTAALFGVGALAIAFASRRVRKA